jgi:F0F1-type ATP synthase membrane subunit b/b'
MTLQEIIRDRTREISDTLRGIDNDIDELTPQIAATHQRLEGAKAEVSG